MSDLQAEGARQLKFLVIDDEADLRDLFCTLIERVGHLARPAADGLEAVEALQEESFDVMLLDLSMPSMGGVEVARWLQAHPDVAPTMRVAVVSALATHNRASLAELGITTVMEKPLRLQRLRELIAETLHGPRCPWPG